MGIEKWTVKEGKMELNEMRMTNCKKICVNPCSGDCSIMVNRKASTSVIFVVTGGLRIGIEWWQELGLESRRGEKLKYLQPTIDEGEKAEWVCATLVKVSCCASYKGGDGHSSQKVEMH